MVVVDSALMLTGLALSRASPAPTGVVVGWRVVFGYLM